MDPTAGDGGRHRHVVLVGPMGVGKTTVGRRLARELQRPFADADEQLELRTGRTIPAIFRDDGEEAFRRLESEVLADLLGCAHPVVLAAGGGVVMRTENRALLGRRAFVVWLRASAGFLAARADPTHRPLLTGEPDPAAALERLVTTRAPLYEEVADATVDVEPFHAEDDKPKRALARHVARLVGVPVEAPG
ncbi:MAG TPA: shikimate kinase [Acidimicrobiales bacterium]|nr:shikimate kinase [Acidimicrobiales bacterium]